MVEGLEGLLESSGQPGLAELRQALREITGWKTTCRLASQQQLKPRIYRLRIDAGYRVQSFVVKRLDPSLAQRNQLVIRRWLPAIGLGEACPRLLGTAAERGGQCVWHIYEDLGEWELDTGNPDHLRVGAAVQLIGQMHTRAANHPLIPEWRKFGDDFGGHFFASNVRDAIRGLESLRPSDLEQSLERIALRNRLLQRVYTLLDESPARTQAMAELGGPETLLHGDLWATNTLVVPTAEGLKARLIDWDHAGVGPISYDLSTFLYRFPPADRSWVMERYRQSVERVGWRLPSPRDLNLLFATAECARYVNCVAWYAMALRHERADWGLAMLAEVERWFESLSPVLDITDKVQEHEHGRYVEYGSDGLPHPCDSGG